MTNPSTYEFLDLLYASSSKLFITAAHTTLGLAVKYGKAGAVAAIDNQKSTWLTIFTGILYHQWPNALQWSGMVTGFIGLNFIFLQKTEKQNEVEKS